MKVYFLCKEGDENYAFENAKKFFKQFNEDFDSIDYLYPEFDENDIPDEEWYDNFEMQFDSRWSTPTEKLEEYSKLFNCTFLGVSYEWGNGYVNSFDINNTIGELPEPTEQEKGLFEQVNEFQEYLADAQINRQKEEE
jgi:hypothetical protein